MLTGGGSAPHHAIDPRLAEHQRARAGRPGKSDPGSPSAPTSSSKNLHRLESNDAEMRVSAHIMSGGGNVRGESISDLNHAAWFPAVDLPAAMRCRRCISNPPHDRLPRCWPNRSTGGLFPASSEFAARIPIRAPRKCVIRSSSTVRVRFLIDICLQQGQMSMYWTYIALTCWGGVR